MEEKTALPQEDVKEVANTPSVKKKHPFWKNKKKFPFIIGISVLVMIVLVVAVVWDLNSNQPQNKQTNAQDLSSTPDASISSSNLKVKIIGNHLVNAQGQTVRLIGINQTASNCANQGDSIFREPTDQASVVELTKWHINTVRVTMNEDCWLGINNAPSATSGSNYRNAIINYIKLLHSYGMYAIVDLHMNAPGNHLSVTQQIMADADHAPTYWTSVANTFKNDPAVIFEPYNEPDVNTTNALTTNPWDCWLHGCTVKYLYSDFYLHQDTPYSWKTTGMQQLVDAIRATGATNVITIGGLKTSHDLSQLLAYLPSDPQHQLAATFHNYELATTNAGGCGPGSSTAPDCWDTVILSVAQHMPVITDELGDTACQTNYSGYVTQYMNWADQHGISYLPWGWFVYTGGTNCSNNHLYDMLKNSDGTPNYYGMVFFDHFAKVNLQGPLPTPTPTTQPKNTPTPTPQPVSSNIITNGSFENAGTSWLEPWGLNVQQGANGSVSQSTQSENGTYSAKITVTQTNAHAYFLQLNQGNLSFTKGRTYTLSFWAKAAANRPLTYSLVQNYSPYNAYLLNTVNLTTSWQNFTTTYTPTVTDSNVELNFGAATASPAVFIDNVSIK